MKQEGIIKELYNAAYNGMEQRFIELAKQLEPISENYIAINICEKILSSYPLLLWGKNNEILNQEEIVEKL